jgi:hypothetical protein
MSHARDSQAGSVGHLGAVMCRREAGVGYSVVRKERLLAAAMSPVPQMIRTTDACGPGLGTFASANHLPMICTAIPGVAVADVSERFAMHDNGVGKGMTSIPNDEKKHVVDMGDFQQCDLDFTSNPLHNEDDYYNAGLGKGGTTDKVLLPARGIFLTWAFRTR